MGLNLNSKPSTNKTIDKQESNLNTETIKKSKHSKKSNSKMFDKIFEAMNTRGDVKNKAQKSKIEHPNHNEIIKTNISKPQTDKTNKTSNFFIENKAANEKFDKNTQEIKTEKLNELSFRSVEKVISPEITSNESMTKEESLKEVISNSFSDSTPNKIAFSEVNSKPGILTEPIDSLLPNIAIEVRTPSEKNKGKEESLDNLINDIKVAKAEANQFNLNTSTKDDSNWIITDFRTDKLKLSDWVEAFKADIQKLNSFRTENQNKVSLVIKNDNELIRVVVEKKENVIVINAKSTEDSKEKLSYILTEIQSEMAEKDVEVLVNIEDEQQEEDSFNNEQEQDEPNSSDEQGEKNNDSNKRRKQ